MGRSGFGCIYILLIKDGPIQTRVREGERDLFGSVHCTITEDREVCGDKVHEEKV
jgi:hypothetical protein